MKEATSRHFPHIMVIYLSLELITYILSGYIMDDFNIYGNFSLELQMEVLAAENACQRKNDRNLTG